MAKVIFTVQYDVIPEKREDFLTSVKELKSLIKAEGLESYEIFEIKGKSNSFQENYLFTSEDSYDNFDDAENERVNILISKIETLKVHNTTRYNTLLEV